MKRIIISTMCIVAALVFASCNKIEEINNPGDITNTEEDLGRTIINGVVESIDTKAELSYGYDVLWNTGDKIYVTTGTKDDTFTLSKGEGTTSGQFTEDNKKGITGSIEAFYPASLKTDDGYVWPAIQETNNLVAPMYAKQTITGAEGEVVSFSSLGAMLQIGFNTQTNGIVLTSITLKDRNKPLSGKFTVTDGQAVLESNSENPGVTLDLGDGVPVGLSPKYFYIAIPAGEYRNLTITFNSEDGKVCEMNSTTFPEVRRNTVGKLTLTGTFENKSLVLPGIFSISDKSRVQFSRGNLVCMSNLDDPWGDSFTFTFENNQYDYRCRSGVQYDYAIIDGKPSFTPGGTSGFFQWVSENAADNYWEWNYAKSYVYDSCGGFTEINKKDCTGKDTDVVDFSRIGDGWSAPSHEEWRYLTSKRTNANLLFRTNVSVNGVDGALIAPDDWDTSRYPIVGEGSPSSYDKSTWSKMESMGLVFFPYAGYYPISSVDNEGAYINKFFSYYWLSTGRLTDHAVCIPFNSYSDIQERQCALPVRLITRNNVPLTVTFDMNGHGTAPADITGVQYKSKINEPIKPSVKNCLFDGWYKEASCTNKWDFENDIVTEDITLYAKWIELPDGVLSGMFTVAEGKQVHFSQGNLWYGKVGSAQTATYNFEENQYGTHGYDYISNTWGLFGWSTSATNYGMSTSVTNSDYSGVFVDWGKAIDNEGTWRTLSKDEWGYLFNGRDGAANKYGYATVSSKVGLIILPDEFTDPMKNSGSNAFVTGVTNTFASNLYSPENWAAMESAGAIFLPAAERRFGTNISADQSGSYWSSSASSTDTDKAYYLFFNINNFNSAEQWDRYRGFSVRLVTDVK